MLKAKMTFEQTSIHLFSYGETLFSYKFLFSNGEKTSHDKRLILQLKYFTELIISIKYLANKDLCNK